MVGVKGKRSPKTEMMVSSVIGEAVDPAVRSFLCSAVRLKVPLCIRAPVRDTDDFHHVRLHAVIQHVRADSCFPVSRTDIVGRSADQPVVAQRFARRLNAPRTGFGLRLSPMPDGVVPDSFQVTLGCRRQGVWHPAQADLLRAMKASKSNGVA